MTDQILLIMGCVISFITLAGMRAGFSHGASAPETPPTRTDVNIGRPAHANDK